MKETVKEFAQIDGIFILDEKGFIRSGGAYLNTDTSDIDLPGLGARHHACAAVTQETDAISVCISESGVVRVFRDGKLIVEEKIKSS
jgi:DNA integrity scanning protein DisA with diadenylate cyclase activity